MKDGLLRKLCVSLLVLPGLTTLSHAQSFTGVLTQHNDYARTGQNLNETTLTPQNVNSSTFGKVFSYSVDGQIYAQPLYVPNVSIPNQGTHNVVYVATENDSIYAFDADGLSSTPLWQDSFINLAGGVGPIPCWKDGILSLKCGIYPLYGITGTPVIDPTSNTMYLVVRTEEKGAYVQRLHAIDITTGAEKFGGPVQIEASVPGSGAGSSHGMISFQPLLETQRAGLLLANGLVYIGWAGAHGWIMGYDATTLQQVAVLNTTPNSFRGGVWQSDSGLVADSSGNIFVALGDGPFDATLGGVDYGDSVLKLNSNLKVLDYFTPIDEACRLPNDLDLGAAGPMLLPPQPGAYPNELVIAGKGGSPCDFFGSTAAAPIYLLNQANLGKYSATVGMWEIVPGAPNGYWSNPTYWQGQTAANIYLAGQNKDLLGDQLKMYTLTNGRLSDAATAQTSNTFAVGATPSISANGQTDGIVWAIERQDSLDSQPGILPAILYAYDATNVAVTLYGSADVPERDQGGCANKFQIPTVANGRVYVGTQNELDVFGLLSSGSLPQVYLPAPCYDFPTTFVYTTSRPETSQITNSGAAALTIQSVSITGDNAKDFKITANTCGATLKPGDTCSVTTTFTPTENSPRVGYITIQDSAVGSPHNIFVTGKTAVTSMGISPTAIAFGDTVVGQQSSPIPITLTNLKSAPVQIKEISFSGTDKKDFTETNNCMPKIDSFKNCTVQVTFAPTASGQRTAMMSIVDNAAGSPHIAGVVGQGTSGSQKK